MMICENVSKVMKSILTVSNRPSVVYHKELIFVCEPVNGGTFALLGDQSGQVPTSGVLLARQLLKPAAASPSPQLSHPGSLVVITVWTPGPKVPLKRSRRLSLRLGNSFWKGGGWGGTHWLQRRLHMRWTPWVHCGTQSILFLHNGRDCNNNKIKLVHDCGFTSAFVIYGYIYLSLWFMHISINSMLLTNVHLWSGLC